MRIKLIVGFGTVVGAEAVVAFVSKKPWAVGILPALICAWILFTIFHTYLLVRGRRWSARKRAEEREVDDLKIPVTVPKPEEFAGVKEIDEAEHQRLRPIPDMQGKLFAWGIVVALMPPLAVLLAAVQIQAINDAHLLLGLSAAEAMVMLALIVIVKWAIPHPTKRWVPARTRAELLRREQYLRLAEVGPYQGLDPAKLGETTQARIQQITTTDGEALAALIPMRDEQQAWLDRLWTAPPGPRIEDVVRRAESYLHYRIRKQVLWFERNTTAKTQSEKTISSVILGALALTVVIIGVQLWLQFGHEARQSPWGTSVLTLVLPPACAFLLATAELFSFARLATSYRQMKTELVSQQGVLERLINSGELEREARRFQAVVLHTEAALTDELLRWIMLTDRAEFTIAMG